MGSEQSPLPCEAVIRQLDEPSSIRQHPARSMLENAWTARHVTEVLLAGLEAGRAGKTVELTTTADMPG